MRKILPCITAILTTLLVLQAAYIHGFNNGADTAMCVTASLQENAKSELCDRVEVNSLPMKGVRAWRRITGDVFETTPR